MILFSNVGNAKSKTSKTPASTGVAKGSSPEVKLGSYFSSSIDGKRIIIVPSPCVNVNHMCLVLRKVCVVPYW